MTALTIFCAKYLFVAVFLCVAASFWKATPSQRRTLVLRGLVVALLSVIFAKGAGALYEEPRPFVVLHVAPLIPHEPDNGFPSDHTLLVFACAFLLAPFMRSTSFVAILIGVAVGGARIASHLHSPLDIAASILFALVGNVVAGLLIRTSVKGEKNTATA